jgi:dynein heavy chain
LADLNRSLEEKKLALADQQAQKQKLIEEKEDAMRKKNRAETLMTSIGSERDRWILTKKKLAEDKLSILGDMILATGFVNYLGPFEGSYRLKILEESW